MISYSLPLEGLLENNLFGRLLCTGSIYHNLRAVDFTRSHRPRDALRKDPSFDPTFDELLEVSLGSAVDLRYADVQAATTADPFSKQSRRAILVHADVDFGIARMYELMHGGHIQVFRSLERAREFLGLNGK